MNVMVPLIEECTRVRSDESRVLDTCVEVGISNLLAERAGGQAEAQENERDLFQASLHSRCRTPAGAKR